MFPERMDLIDAFLNGIIVMGHASAGLFFVRFWRKTKDRLFVFFAVAFWHLGLMHLAMVVLNHPGENRLLFTFRLAAYLIILAAIIDKNWRDN
jgi:Family of unknown function (DUF5985)